MNEVNINGIRFNAADGEASDFGYFIEGDPKGNDTGQMGMVEEMKAFIRVVRERSLINLLDVGALWGVFSLVFTHNERATAWAIEPSLDALSGLGENVSLNPGRAIRVRSAFCSEKTGDIIPCGKDWKHLVAHGFLESEGACSMQGVAIDDMHWWKLIDCMKIDVEGFECSVLRGAKKTIEKFRPIIFLEAHLQSLTPAGETPEGLYALLKGFGYRICRLDDTPLESFAGYSHARVICYPV